MHGLCVALHVFLSACINTMCLTSTILAVCSLKESESESWPSHTTLRHHLTSNSSITLAGGSARECKRDVRGIPVGPAQALFEESGCLETSLF